MDSTIRHVKVIVTIGPMRKQVVLKWAHTMPCHPRLTIYSCKLVAGSMLPPSCGPLTPIPANLVGNHGEFLIDTLLYFLL